MIETLIGSPEFEQKVPYETERTFIPIFDDELRELRHTALPIEQLYLSHPKEPYSLRLREQLNASGELIYTATLKDRGIVEADGLKRLEIETTITPELYAYYRQSDPPVIRKLRAVANNSVVIDFFEDGYTHIESEHPIGWAQFCEQHGDRFVEVTGDRQSSTEWRAHQEYRRQHEARESLIPQDDLDPDAVATAIAHEYYRNGPQVIALSGRSGSGKSTVVRQIVSELEQYALRSAVVSTDDYHRGASWLRHYNNGQDWTEWDHPIVYDTEQLADDLTALKNGQTVAKRGIDFTAVEPFVDGLLEPAPIVIIEGIYAGCADLADQLSLRYDLPTSLATCVGRRIMRDMRERPQFTPESNLRYILEQAEPMWRQQATSHSA